MTQLTIHGLARRTAHALKRYPLYRTLELLNESQYWLPGELKTYRNEKLARLVAHAYANSAFYRGRMDALRLKPADLRTIDDLPKLPVLTRRDVRTYGPEMICKGPSSGQPVAGRTSGSTGEPLIAYNDLRGIVWGNAAYFRGLGWAGYDFDRHRMAVLFGGPLPHEKAPARAKIRQRDGLLTLSAYDFRSETSSAYFESLQSFRPHFLKGYAGATYLMARAYDEPRHGSLHLRAIFTTSEYLPPSQRRRIEASFKAPVFDYYGCVEIASLGYECGQHAGYHVPQEHVVFECITDRSDPELDNGCGSFVITDLDNYYMPLIRYQNGDAGELSDQPCACGRTLRRITRLYGRTTDLLRGTDGNWIDGGVVDYIVSGSDHILHFRLMQVAADRCIFEYVTEGSDDDAKSVVSDLKAYLGPDMVIDLDRREMIEPSRSGKRRLTICCLPEFTDGSLPPVKEYASA